MLSLQQVSAADRRAEQADRRAAAMEILLREIRDKLSA